MILVLSLLVFPLSYFPPECLTRFDRIHIDLYVWVKYYCRSLFASTLTETILDNELTRIWVELPIRDQALLDKWRKSLRAGASFADFDSERRHGGKYREKEGKSKKIPLSFENGIFSFHISMHPHHPPRTSLHVPHGSSPWCYSARVRSEQTP